MGTKATPGKYDCYDKAGDDEPLFVLRAKDPLAPGLVRDWAMARDQTVPGDDERVQEAFDCADAMEAWRARSVALD